MAKRPSRIPLTGEVTIDVRVTAGSSQVVDAQVLSVIADLPSVTRTTLDQAKSEQSGVQFRLLVTTCSLAAMLAEIGKAPTLIHANLSWSTSDELIIALPTAALEPLEGTDNWPGNECFATVPPIERPYETVAATAPTDAATSRLRRLLRSRPRGDALSASSLPSSHAKKEDRKAKPLSHVHIPARTVACIIPAHNEEAVIAATLRTVLVAYDAADVFVYGDACTDRTVEIARNFLPAENVIDHPVNVGKSKGLEYILNTYIYPMGYQYVTITDADTTMDPQFLVNTLRVLRNKDVAATVGQVKARWYPKNVIAVYRAYVYTIWQVLYKRMQSITNSINIASGCSTTWKTRVLKQLDFDHNMSTEDFSLTMQVHRKRLGKIKYVSAAVVWSQEPWSLRSYRKQMYRWNRAWWESVRKYRVGVKWVHTKRGIPVGLSVLDISTFLLTFDVLFFFFSIVVLPILVVYPVDIHFASIPLDSRSAVLWSLAWQYTSVLASALVVAVLTRKPRIFLYSPIFLLLVYLDMFIWAKAVASTAMNLYRKVETPTGQQATASVWESPERREVA